MHAARRDALVQSWLEEERRPFVGWDFSYLEGRMEDEGEPWSYLERAAELMGRSSSVVDMDTGGGEKLLSLSERWPPGSSPPRTTRRTSSWRPNVSRPWEPPWSGPPSPMSPPCPSTTASSTWS